MNFNYYIPEKGESIIHTYGFQFINEDLTASSRLISGFYGGVGSNRFSVDSARQTGDVYYANRIDGYVSKVKFGGEEIARINLIGPTMVSVIQNNFIMPSIIPQPPAGDRGCWILDHDGNRLIRTDNLLNEQFSIKNVLSVTGIKTAIDDGCFFTNDYSHSVIKLNGEAKVDAYIFYSDIDANWTKFRDMAVNYNGDLYLASDKKIYVYRVISGQFQNVINISPIGLTEDFIGAIDIDLYSQILYVTGGADTYWWISKYTTDGVLVDRKEYEGNEFPFVIKVSQYPSSDGLYVLGDPLKWDEYAYGSSSSTSSNSSSIDSSSTSSSSSSIDSSSSSTENNPVVAYDNALDPVYPGDCPGGWCDGLNGGFGWADGWLMVLTSYPAGRWLDDDGRGGLISSSNRSWGLWSHTGTISDARRYFPHIIRARRVFR